MWKVYYSNGSTISSQDASPWSIVRRNGIQVIVEESPEHIWVTISGSDYYIWDERYEVARWLGVDQFGFYDYMLKPGHRCVLFGETISASEFRKIFDRAQAELGNKEVFRPDERHPE